jgi:hypothetical protein
MNNLQRTIPLIISLATGGCISTQEMPLAPNVVRIDTQAQGWLFTGRAVPQTMRAAANATLERGYTNFKFAEANVAQGEVTTGAIATYGGGVGTVSAVGAPVTGNAVTVVMFHAEDPQAKDSFDAKQILAQYPQ